MNELVKYVDVGIANEEDCQKSLGISAGVHVESGELELAKYEALSNKVLEVFPDMSTIAITLRESRSADINGWSACMRDKSGFYHSRKYEMTDIVDRVGGGDSFASGLIYGFLTANDALEAVEYGAAHGALAMTTPGDTTMATLQEVEKVKGGGSARVDR